MDTLTVLRAYLECALWSSTDDDGNPLDGMEFDPSVIVQARKDVSDFIHLLQREGIEYPGTDEQFGYDFWLTRNGHGAGFWDRGHGDVGDTISKLAESYGSIDLYVGDDGKVYG